MLEIIFCFMQEFFQLYVLKRFMNIFFYSQRKKGKMQAFLLIFFWGLKAALSIIWNLSLFNLLSSIIMYLVIAVLDYEDKFWRKLLGVFFILSIEMVCEDIVWIILNHFWVEINYDFLGSTVSYLLLLILQIFLQKYLSIGRRVEMVTSSYLFMLLIPICSIVITDILVEGNFKTKFAQLIGIAMVMLINILAFYLYDMILKSYEERSKNILLEKQVSMYENQFRIIKESQDNLHSFRHDIKHHFIMIKEYARKQKVEELFAYIDQSLNYIEVEKEYVRSGNEEIDCILNYMIEQAKKQGAEVAVKLAIAEERFMSGLDLNVLLSNLLENAIDALKSVEDKRLDICINMDKGILYISVYNTYSEIKQEQGRFLSWKRNYSRKGIGLENVQKIVEKYNGKIEITYDDMFKVDVILILD